MTILGDGARRGKRIIEETAAAAVRHQHPGPELGAAAKNRQDGGFENVFCAHAQHESSVSAGRAIFGAEDRLNSRTETVQGHHRNQEDENRKGQSGGEQREGVYF